MVASSSGGKAGANGIAVHLLGIANMLQHLRQIFEGYRGTRFLRQSHARVSRRVAVWCSMEKTEVVVQSSSGGKTGGGGGAAAARVAGMPGRPSQSPGMEEEEEDTMSREAIRRKGWVTGSDRRPPDIFCVFIRPLPFLLSERMYHMNRGNQKREFRGHLDG